MSAVEPRFATVAAEDERTAAHVVVQIAATIWWNLPLLLGVDLILLLGALPTVVAAVVAPAVAPVVAAATFGPLWVATIALTDRLWTGRAGSLPLVVRLVRRHWAIGVTLSLVPAVGITILLGTLQIVRDHPDQRWLLVPLLFDGSAIVLIMLAGFAVVSLAVTTGLHGRAAWRGALMLVAVRPAPTLMLLTLVALIASAARLLGPVFLISIIAPFAVVLSATTARALHGWPARIITREGVER